MTALEFHPPVEASANALPTNYEPMEGLKAVAVAEAAEIYFRRAKDTTKLFEAIRLKLTEQRRFVLWWDGLGDKRGRPKKTSQNGDVFQTLADLGVDGMTVHRWRKRLTDVDDFKAEQEKACGRGVKITEFQAGASGVDSHRTIGTGENEWYTPPEFIHLAREVMGGIDLDPASSDEANETIRAPTFYDAETDGLAQQWSGRVWLNPPYSRDLMPKFMEKLRAEYESGNISAAIVVTHNNTDTGWFRSLSGAISAICFTSGRIKFYRGETVAAPVNGQMFIYLGDDVPGFKRTFSPVGYVMVPA